MRVAFVACSAPARTAVGNLLAEKVAFFLDREAETRVFLESLDSLHPQLIGHCHPLTAVPTAGPAWDYLSQADLVFFEFSQGFDLLGLLPLLVHERPKLIASYYGISPAAGWPGPQRDLLERGFRDRGLLWCADAVSVLSRFTIDEVQVSTALPRDRFQQHKIPLDIARWQNPSSPEDRSNKSPVLLYVGRLAPNKRLPLLIEALVDLPEAEAWVVGNDRDIYADQARTAKDLAKTLGVADRIRWLGDVADDALPAIYRQASVLVLPSIHEGFGIPVLEAQAAGLPVVAARAAALPETVADAGLTFRPEDRSDLVRQIRRVLPLQAPRLLGAAGVRLPARRRIALVGFRFGAGFIGGAETSLRNLGKSLQREGYDVEVFTTCTHREFNWQNDLPAGDTTEDGFLVHRFPIDPHDRPRHDNAFRTILEKNGDVPPALEAEYLANSIQSSALIAALEHKKDDFDAFITTPYLHGLTFRVAQTFPEKTILLPCFHDEPLARLKSWHEVYGRVAGLFYHTPEEQDFAQTLLGLNHPGAAVIGAWIPRGAGFPACNTNGRLESLPHARTLVYCGRYSIQKNLPQLIDFIERYQAKYPDRFRWVFLGEGSVRPPQQPWASDLGRVTDEEKHRILAQSDALVQLSTQESLSLVVLEAWQHATPVIVHKDAPVLVGQIARSGGGMAIGNFEDFAQSLDDLWTNPDAWNERGQAGQRYVETAYLDQDAYARRVVAALEHTRLPLAEQMRRRGLERVKSWDRPAWREEFGRFIEQLLDAPQRSAHLDLKLEPLSSSLSVSVQQSSLLLPVRLVNRGTLPAIANGPAATMIEISLRDGETGRDAQPVREFAVGDLVLPGRTGTTLLPIDLPRVAGRYTLSLRVLERGAGFPACREENGRLESLPHEIPLEIGNGASHSVFEGGVGPLLESVQLALAHAHSRQELPVDYLDVCEGRFARWKRMLKQKLLNNFKRAYVDVLSTQQSEVNRRLVESVQHLSDCCRALDQTVRSLQQRVTELSASNDKAETDARQEEESQIP